MTLRRGALLAVLCAAAGCREPAPALSRPASEQSATALGPSASASARAASSTRGKAADGSLDELLRHCADHEGPPDAACDGPLQRLARQTARLEVDGVGHPASHVYVCEDLSRRGRERDPWRCRSAVTHADDTLHTIEFPHQTVALAAKARLRLLDADGRPATALIKVGAGPALELHADGYVVAHRLSVDEQGRIDPADVPDGGTVLLFALVRHDSEWVRKHVWVLERR